MRALTIGLLVMSAWSCGLDFQGTDDATGSGLDTKDEALRRRRPRPTDAGPSTPVVDAGVPAPKPDAGTPAPPPPLTDVESHNMLVAYDIRVDVAASYLTAQPASNFNPVATSNLRVFTIGGVFYYHANVYYWDFGSDTRKTREIWVSPSLNQYYVRNNGVKGPVALGVSGAGKFWPDNFTLEKLAQFSVTSELF